MLGYFLKKTQGAIWFLAGCAIFFTVPAQAAYKCGPTQEIMIALMQDGFQQTFVAEVNSKMDMNLFLDDLGNYRVLIVANKKACQVLSGSGFRQVPVLKL